MLRANPLVEPTDSLRSFVCPRFLRRSSFWGEKRPVFAPLLEQPGLPLEQRDQRRYLGAVPIGCNLKTRHRNLCDKIFQDRFLGRVEAFLSWPPAVSVRLGVLVHVPPLHLLEDFAASLFKQLSDDPRYPTRHHFTVLLGSHLALSPQDDRE